MTSNIFLSIIIPLYNEQGRLKKLQKVYEFLKRQKFTYEIILVNDGSQDNTLKKLKELSGKLKFQLITYEKNKGKGFAIKTGILAAKGKYRLFTDIDLSTPLEELNKFIPYLSKIDVLIGSRKMKGSSIKKRQSWARESLGKGFTLLSQMFLGLNITDFTCGFKCFSKKAVLNIFPRQKLERWGFDAEILFLAKKLRLKIKEIPVNWSNDPKSKVKFPQDIVLSLSDLCKIRYNNFRGLYD